MKCKNCGEDISIISSAMPYCYKCLTMNSEYLKGYVESIHGAVRKQFELPPKAVKAYKSMERYLFIETEDDVEKITAKLSDGVLVINLPKKKPKKKRKVKIK